MKTRQAFLNGEWIADGDLSVSVHDVGFLMGAIVTERLRTFRHEVFRLDEHMARMRHSLEIIGLDAADITRQISDAIAEFADHNRGQIDTDDDWSITAFATPGPTGADHPTVCVHGFPLLFHTFAAKYDEGVSVTVSDVRQVPSDCWPAELKCRSRMHYYLADLQAGAEHPGARAVLLDHEGFLGETSTANLVLYSPEEGLLSPPMSDVLPGVSAGMVRELAGRLGIPWTERRLVPDELRSAAEATLTSTSVCMLPIVRCDGQPIGGGKPGPVYGQLLRAWSEAVGVDVADQARRFVSRS